MVKTFDIFMKKSPSLRRGFALEEVLVATAIILVFVTALSGAYSLYVRAAFASLHKVQSALLAEEGIEVVKLLRDSSWSLNMAPLSNSTPYYLVFSGGTWKATTTKTLVDGVFDRSFTVENVYRNLSIDIVDKGGTLDSGTRLIMVSEAWLNHGATTTKSISTYVTNLFAN